MEEVGGGEKGRREGGVVGGIKKGEWKKGR